MSRYFPLKAMCCLAICFAHGVSKAQPAVVKFAKLLWYTGTGINDTVIKTKSGKRVTYSPSSRKVTVEGCAGVQKVGQPGFNNDKFCEMLKRLENKEQRKHVLTQTLMKAPHGPRNLGLVRHVNMAVDDADNGKSYLKNNDIRFAAESSVSGAAEKIPDWVHINWGEVMKYVGKMKSESSFDPPPPPEKDFDYCFACDSARQRAYQIASDEFIKDFLKEETEMLEKAMNVMNYFGVRRAKKNKYDVKTAEYMEPDMTNAIIAIRKRIDLKLTSAWTKYRGDAKRIPFLLELITKEMHTDQVLGIEINNLPEFADLAEQSVSTAKKYLAEAADKKDYRVLLNVRWIVELFRRAELLGLPQSELDRSLYAYLALNQFEVNIDADAKMGGEGVFTSAQLTGKNTFNVIPDSNCVLKWTLQSPDLKYMEFNLVKATMEAREISPTYIGAKAWKTQPADLRLDFCKEEKDSAIFFAFFPKDGKDLWNLPPNGPMELNQVRSLFHTCFLDIELLKKKAAEYSNPEAMERLKKEIMEKYQSGVAPNAAMMKKDPSTMTPEEIKNMSKLADASRDILSLTQSPLTDIFVLKSSLQNNKKLVFEKRLDGKEVATDNRRIVYAYYTVRIEHVE